MPTSESGSNSFANSCIGGDTQEEYFYPSSQIFLHELKLMHA